MKIDGEKLRLIWPSEVCTPVIQDGYKEHRQREKIFDRMEDSYFQTLQEKMSMDAQFTKRERMVVVRVSHEDYTTMRGNSTPLIFLPPPNEKPLRLCMVRQPKCGRRQRRGRLPRNVENCYDSEELLLLDSGASVHVERNADHILGFHESIDETIVLETANKGRMEVTAYGTAQGIGNVVVARDAAENLVSVKQLTA